MKVHLRTATIALVSVPGLMQAGWTKAGVAQSARTGVSNPEPVVITAQPDETVTVKVEPAKPSAAIPYTAAPGTTGTARPLQRHEAARGSSAEAYGTYVPYRGGAGAGAEGPARLADPDGSIVTSVEERAGELREGTLLRARIRQSLSTVTTAPGSTFSAALLEPVEKNGRVVLPVGALIEGRVTEVHGGRRITGAATLHLEPRTVTLPDGTHYVIHAQLIDTDQTAHTTVDREGTLVRRDHPKETRAGVGLATGGAAVAGGLVGGGVGALVGAGIGAGAGTIVWLKQDRQAVLPQESMLVFSLTEAMPVMPVSHAPVSRVERPGMTPRVRSAGEAAGGIVE